MSDQHEYVHDCECHDCLRATVRQLNAELTEVKVQRDDIINDLSAAANECSVLRKIISDCAYSLGTGAFLTAGATIHIMRELPGEIQKTIVMLKADRFNAEDECDAAKRLAQQYAEALANDVSGRTVTISASHRDYLESLEKDALRYRWLRSREAECNVEIPSYHLGSGHGYAMPGFCEGLDSTIDAAMIAAAQAQEK